MVQLASMVAGQALAESRVMLGAALTVGVTPVEPRRVGDDAVAATYFAMLVSLGGCEPQVRGQSPATSASVTAAPTCWPS